MISQENADYSRQHNDRAPVHAGKKRLKKIAKRIISFARESRPPEQITVFEKVCNDTSAILTLSEEIEPYLVAKNDLNEDITRTEIDAILALFSDGTRLVANSSLFDKTDHTLLPDYIVDDPDRIIPMYGLLRDTYGEPIADMNAYRYIAVRYKNPEVYGLEYEFFVIGLHKHDEPNQKGEVETTVLGKASLEPVFLDVVDGLSANSGQFSTPDELAALVKADKHVLKHTLSELQKKLGAQTAQW